MFPADLFQAFIEMHKSKIASMGQPKRLCHALANYLAMCIYVIACEKAAYMGFCSVKRLESCYTNMEKRSQKIKNIQ